MALTFKPYRLHGLRSSLRTRYQISDGYAYIFKLRPFGWIAVQTLPLEDISTRVDGTDSQKLLGRGDIKITNVSGDTMLWENVRNTKVVQDALYNWKTLEESADEIEGEQGDADAADARKGVPPTDVIFGDQVAFVPSLPDFFDVPLWKQAPVPSFGKSSVKFGSWVEQGDELTYIGIYKHDPDCLKCRSSFRRFLTLDSGEKHGTITTSVLSPISGLLIRDFGLFGDGYLDDLNDSRNERAMCAILLPANASVPKTFESSVSEFCKVCSEYRESIFRSDRVISAVDSGSEAEAREIWSDKEIDEVLAALRKRPVIVRTLSSLAFDEEMEKLKLRYPANFQ